MEHFKELTFMEIIKYLTDINSVFDLLKVVIDVSIVSYVIYKVIMLVKETRAWQLSKGIVFIIIIAKISGPLGLKTISYILNNTIQYFVLTLVILFQPELRRGLEQIGRSRFGAFFNFDDEKQTENVDIMIEEISNACVNMSANKVGALIVLELETKIGDVIDSGIKLDSKVTSELILSIFSPNTPLHDGALIIRENKIMAAACFLPLTENTNLSKTLGTRHRAALGISEVSDSVAIVVSEETGTISIARNGILKMNLSSDFLRKQLKKYITENESNSKKLTLWKVKKSVSDK